MWFLVCGPFRKEISLLSLLSEKDYPENRNFVSFGSRFLFQIEIHKHCCCCCCCCWVASVVSDSVRPHRRQPTRLPRPCDSPGKNTGVGSHFLLQRMKVKIESEVAQLCPTLCDPMDCSLPGSSVHGIFQARVHNSLIQGMLDKLFLTQWPRSVNMNNLRLGWRIEAIALDLGLRMMFYPASWTLL